MRTGAIEANLPRLNEEADAPFHRREYERLRRELEAAAEVSPPPNRPSARPALNDPLVRLRMRSTRSEAIAREDNPA